MLLVIRTSFSASCFVKRVRSFLRQQSPQTASERVARRCEVPRLITPEGRARMPLASDRAAANRKGPKKGYTTARTELCSSGSLSLLCVRCAANPSRREKDGSLTRTASRKWCGTGTSRATKSLNHLRGNQAVSARPSRFGHEPNEASAAERHTDSRAF